MKELYIKHKWKMAWCCFAILIAVFSIVTYKFHSKDWYALFLQVFGLMLTIYPTVLIFVQSRADGDRSMRAHLEQLQLLNQKEMDTMQVLFQKQIDVIVNSTKEQINEFKNTTNEQIKAIEANTNKQIENYTKQTTEIVTRLEDNSVLLAELLIRQLETDISILNSKLDDANKKLAERSKWKLLRTPEEKQKELGAWNNYIGKLQEKLHFLNSKWKQVKNFLNGGE